VPLETAVGTPKTLDLSLLREVATPLFG